MNKKLLSGLTAAVLLSALPAFAINQGGNKARGNDRTRITDTRQHDDALQRWNQMDTNRDGVLSRSEWTWDATTFDRLDANGDRVLTQREARAGFEEWREDRDTRDSRQKMKHRGMDKNRDGVITRSEWRGNDNSFRKQDRNNDGVLSGDELRPGARKSGRR